MRTYKIYAHINNINGKLYIGQTCRKDIKKRFGKNGIQYRKCLYLWNAIQKYGWENFRYIILFEGLSKEMADIIEIELIKKYKTTESEFGYNISAGGSGARSNYKTVYQYGIDGEYIGEWQSATVVEEVLGYDHANIAACCLGVCITSHGYVWSYKKLSKSYFDDVNYPYCRRIKQYDVKGNFINRYRSAIEAEDKTGTSAGKIRASCQKNGGNITDGLYRWTYEEFDLTPDIVATYRKGKRRIVQYDTKHGLKIREWDSAREVENELGINHSHIAACCRGKYKTCGGFIWKYEEEAPDVIEDVLSYTKMNWNPKSNTSRLRAKKVGQYSLETNELIKIWDNATEARDYYGGSKQSTLIYKCIKGVANSAYGYKWRFV